MQLVPTDLAWPTTGAEAWGMPEAPKSLPTPDIPQTVWVAVVTVVSEVAVRNAPATTPLASRAALFAKTTMTHRTSAEVAAVASTEKECREALARWKESHSGLAGEEVVVEVPFGVPATQVEGTTTSNKCVGCGNDAGTAFYCGACQKAVWKAARENDPDFGKEG